MILGCACRSHGVLVSCSALVLAAAATMHAAAQGTLYVDDDAPPGGDGLSWDTAFRFLQDALAAADGSTEIHIAQGVYKPDQSEATPDGSGLRTVSFQLVNALRVEGGYLGLAAGPGEDPEKRDVTSYETTLSGDLAGDDQPGFINTADNSFHVLRAIQTLNAELDGLTIIGGFANNMDQNPDDRGGGLLVLDNSSIAMFECTIRGNFATWGGGGIHTDDSQSILIDHCTLVDNASDGGGGGLLASSTSLTVEASSFQQNTSTNGGAIRAGTITVNGSDFQNNAALDGDDYGDGYGGAIACGSAEMTNCHFLGNTALRGGALSFGSSDDGTTSACTFESNSAEYGGAVYWNEYADEHFQDCSFINNHADDDGGAVYVYVTDPTIDSCFFQSNTAGENGGGIAMKSIYDDYDIYLYQSRPIITRCTFDDNAAKSGGAMHSIASQPRLINCRFESNAASVRGGAIASFGLHAYSPEDELYRDYIGRPRAYGCVFWHNESPKGGAVYDNMCISTYVNCTMVSNIGSLAGGVLSNASSQLRMYNCIVKNNPGGPFSGAGQRTVRYSNITGGHPGIGNIDANPKFIDYASGDLRLNAHSPCIDAGRNAYLANFVSTDIVGNPRYADDPDTPDTGVGSPYVVDMGAYEH